MEVPRRCFGGCAAWAGALGGGGQGLEGEFVADDFELGDRPCSGVGRLVPDESRRLSLATAGVGEDGREAVPVGVGDPHLRPGVGSFPAHDVIRPLPRTPRSRGRRALGDH